MSEIFEGYAFAGVEAQRPYTDAIRVIRDLNRNKIVLKTEHERGQTIYHLDPAAVKYLSPIQKLVLASTNVAYGGRVVGDTVYVYHG